MKHIPATAFDDAEPIPSAKAKPKHYLEPTARLDILVAAVALDPDLTPAARRVLTLIVAHYNHRKGYAFPGEDRLAELLGLRRPAVSEAIKLLVKRGWMEVDRTRNGNRNGGNRYRLVLEKAGPMIDEAGLNVRKTKRSEDESDDSSDPERPVLESFNVRFSGSSTSAKPDHNPVREPGEENPARASCRTKRASGSLNEGVSRAGSASSPRNSDSEGDRQSHPYIEPAVIDLWWEKFQQAYPHKPGLAKAKGMFCKVMLERRLTIEQLLEAVEKYHDSKINTEMAFANATAWLHGERWKPENMFRAPEKPVKAKGRTDVSTTTSQPVGTLIAADWHPGEVAWDLVLADEGEEATEDARRGFVAQHLGQRLENPARAWGAFCRDWFDVGF